MIKKYFKSYVTPHETKQSQELEDEEMEDELEIESEDQTNGNKL